MKIYIDTNTFSASPGIYADAEKTKPLPRIVPAVELERGGLEVAFLGENIPAPTDALAIAASIDGTRTQVIAEYGVPVEDAPHATWMFQFALNSEELVEAVEARGSTHLRVGIIATDGEQKRTEWQFLSAVFATASGEIDGKQVESAKDWADAAMRFAQNAEDSASFADEKAQEANALALNASGFADAAKKSATDASASERNASQSAQNAANAATRAFNAATDANSAKESAETAKNAAEKAKTDAETTLRSVQQEAEDVEAAGEQAIENIGEAKNDALVAIDEARGNVYTKSEIDGVATGAEVVVKMNEIIAQLKDYEEVTGEKLPFDFWEAVMAEFQRWQENPNEVKEWVTTSATESTNPYFSTPPTNPVVDFNVKRTTSTHSLSVASFSPQTNVDIFIPLALNIVDALSFSEAFDGNIIAPNALYADYLICGHKAAYTKTVYLRNAESIRYLANASSYFNGRVIARKAKDVSGAFYLAYAYNQDTRFESANNCYAMLSNATAFAGTLDVPMCTNGIRIVEWCRKFNHSVYLPLCSTAKDGFRGTAMSAENISATLDSLPTWTDGASHVITFTGSPGAAELTQESPSVAAAVAKGWTVEL